MRNLVPLTKILLTLGTAVWAIIFREPFSLALLCVLELIILLVSNELFKNVKALMMLCVFAFFLGLIEYIGGGTEKGMCSSGAPYAWHDYRIHLSACYCQIAGSDGGDGTTIESAL